MLVAARLLRQRKSAQEGLALNTQCDITQLTRNCLNWNWEIIKKPPNELESNNSLPRGGEQVLFISKNLKIKKILVLLNIKKLRTPEEGAHLNKIIEIRKLKKTTWRTRSMQLSFPLPICAGQTKFPAKDAGETCDRAVWARVQTASSEIHTEQTDSGKMVCETNWNRPRLKKSPGDRSPVPKLRPEKLWDYPGDAT